MIFYVPKEWPTIQAAVDAAGPGDTILVEPCRVYEEAVVIPPGKWNLLIKGLGEGAVLRAPVAGIDIGFTNLLNNGLEIRNFTIKNFLVGIVDLAGSANTFADLCLKDNIFAGILAIFDKNTTLCKVSIYGSFIAVGNVVSKDLTILDSELEHNALGQTDLLTGGTSVIRTEIEDNELGGTLSILGLRGRYVENEYEGNGPVLGGIFGILDFANVYEKNLITRNFPAGFISILSDEDVIRRNTITRNGAGVVLLVDFAAEVEFNCIAYNHGPGVELVATLFSVVRFNELICNRGGNLVTFLDFGTVLDANQTRGI